VFRRCLWLAAVPLALSACGSNSSSSAVDTHLPIVISDKGCDPATATVGAGKIAFDVTNHGSSKVTEFYVKQNGSTVGEVENVVPGSPKTLTLTLKTGDYEMQCPNGTETERASLTVSESRGSGRSGTTNSTAPNGSVPPPQNQGGGVSPGVTTSPNVTTAR
jgi:iron uptake system EfeUOB component EfeO/EfeM